MAFVSPSDIGNSDVTLAGLGVAARIRDLIGPQHQVSVQGQQAMVEGPVTERVFDFARERCTLRFVDADRGPSTDIAFSTLTSDGRQLADLLRRLVDAKAASAKVAAEARPVAAAPVAPPVLDGAGPQVAAALRGMLGKDATVVVDGHTARVEGPRVTRIFDFAKDRVTVAYDDAPGADVPATPISLMSAQGQKLAGLLGQVVKADVARREQERLAAARAESAARAARNRNTDSSWSPSSAPAGPDLATMAALSAISMSPTF